MPGGTASVLSFTLLQAGLSTGFSLVLGTTLGWVIGRKLAPRPARWAIAALGLPFVLPVLSLATGFVALGELLPAGLWPRYSASAVILAHVWINAPAVAAAVATRVRALPAAPLEAASTLGAKPGQRFWNMAFPLLGPTLLGWGSLVFLACVGSFALVLNLGGGPPVETLETALFAKLRYGALDLPGALGLAALQSSLCVAAWSVGRAFNRDTRAGDSQLRTLAPEPRSWAALAASTACLVALAPYLVSLALVARPSRDAWSEALATAERAMPLAAGVAALTLVLATAALACVMRIPRRLQPWAEGALLLPTGLSSVLLCMGFFFAFQGWLDPFGPDSDGSKVLRRVLLVAGVQALIFLPWAYRMLWPLTQQRPLAALAAARSLGAGRLRATFEIEWPWARPTVGRAFAMAACFALGEVTVATFFGAGGLSLPVLQGRFLGQYRLDDALAVNAVALVLAGLLALAANRRAHA